MGLISKPATFHDNDPIIYSDMNADFDTLYTLVNGALDNANIAAGAGIIDSKLAQITTAGKVSGAALTSLASIPSGAGVMPRANLPSLPGCRVTNSVAGISIPNAVWTALTWDTETFDTDTMHDLVTNTSRITFTTGGVYAVSFNGEFGSNGGGYRRAALVVNGTREIQTAPLLPTGDNYVAMDLSTVRKFTAGDYIEVFVYQNAGGAITYDMSRASEIVSQFAAQYLSPGT